MEMASPLEYVDEDKDMGSGNFSKALDEAAFDEEFLTSGDLTIEQIHNLSSKFALSIGFWPLV
jgi:hypothetical protein